MAFVPGNTLIQWELCSRPYGWYTTSSFSETWGAQTPSKKEVAGCQELRVQSCLHSASAHCCCPGPWSCGPTYKAALSGQRLKSCSVYLIFTCNSVSLEGCQSGAVQRLAKAHCISVFVHSLLFTMMLNLHGAPTSLKQNTDRNVCRSCSQTNALETDL